MADDEQFSLCWNNFNSNLSAGFHESLCRGDLVDVTLAAEGQFVKAHRLVLSVCSPYFRKMFTQMPANQHAFVFLKDVSHTALKDLIQFMYCGEVNVKQEALPAFISTAEALQIKGLTDSDPPPSQSPAEPSTPSPQIQQISSPRVRQRTSTSRSFKIESVDDSGDDKQTQIVIQTTAAPAAQQVVAQPQTQHLQTQSQTHIAPQQIATTTTATTTTVVTHKRPARSVGSGPHIKRTKSTIDPLDTTDVSTGTQQITVQTAVVAAPAPETKTQVQQQQSEPEYIDLPIELPTKSEPDYAEDAGDVDGGENETTYVEDDSYGELRYDESYFTENDDTPAGATTVQTGTGSGGGVNATTSKALVKQQQSSFTDTSYVDVADQGNSDAQVKNIHTNNNNQNKKLTNKSAEAKIPLHAGSRVYVSKHDLAKIFIPNACIYTSRLSELVFGLDVLENIARSNAKQRLLMLDENLLKSIITHVVQVFSMRGETIDDNTVISFIQHKIRNMSNVTPSTASEQQSKNNSTFESSSQI
ncbi:PREDICTED: modifier of mdg4-like isoform X4 [Bactrocera latifrons]|uniref:modifier of mdg4-like isoform X4 n=1 Tax=Bactrocera latifrons TaxID=174628 RepID=UPI0008DCBCFA|nr:PREDICTED: modifier of mdg4-like isoform X4 [Bactrocera latifrons]